MELSKLALVPRNLNRNNLVSYRSIFTIVHLDDHLIFRQGLIQTVINPFYPNSIIHEFDKGNDA